MFLTQENLKEFTGYVRHSSQIEALRFMKIEHCTRPDGSVVVLEEHVRSALGVSQGASANEPDAYEPHWDAVS